MSTSGNTWLSKRDKKSLSLMKLPQAEAFESLSGNTLTVGLAEKQKGRRFEEFPEPLPVNDCHVGANEWCSSRRHSFF